MSTQTLPSAPFSFKDFISSFMLTELFKGMALTGKYMFSRKITVPCAATKTAKNVASLASYVRRYARRWRSPLNRTCVTTALAAPPAMTLI
jgi:formate hydrogenlyase subunit 6/NADH:ubiquinone oxidoreductase subunit I